MTDIVMDCLKEVLDDISCVSSASSCSQVAE